MRKSIQLLALLSLGCASAALAHNGNPRVETKPNIGVMSEEVVRERFATYGHKVISLIREGDSYVIRAEVNGKEMNLELHSLTGAIKQNGVPFTLEPAPHASALVIKPDPQRVRWIDRTIRFDQIGVRGLTPPVRPMPK